MIKNGEMQSRLPASHMMRINADESKLQIINKINKQIYKKDTISQIGVVPIWNSIFKLSYKW